MTTNHEHLREVAEKATPGPWLYRGKSNSWHQAPDPGTNYTYGHSIMDEYNEMKVEDVEYVEAFHPTTAIALLDELAALRTENEGLMEALSQFVDSAEEVNLGGGDAVVTTCESLELARAAIGDSHEC